MSSSSTFVTVSVLGHLGADAVPCASKDGKMFAGFRLAAGSVSRDGKVTREATWFDCSFFTESIGLIDALQKGREVFVEGRLDTRPYFKENGDPAAGLKLYVTRLSLIPGGGMQSVKILGSLGTDPELLVFESGRTAVKFSIAVNRRHISSFTGEVVDRATWFRCIVWGRETREITAARKAAIAAQTKLDAGKKLTKAEQAILDGAPELPANLSAPLTFLANGRELLVMGDASAYPYQTKAGDWTAVVQLNVRRWYFTSDGKNNPLPEGIEEEYEAEEEAPAEVSETNETEDADDRSRRIARMAQKMNERFNR